MAEEFEGFEDVLDFGDAFGGLAAEAGGEGLGVGAELGQQLFDGGDAILL